MNMKSLKTQFIGAIAMVLVAAIAMGSSTYAWFAINTKVTATGMQVTTKVQNNLLIAEDTLMSTTKAAENTFKTSYVKAVDGLLEPVSTINGVDFYYTDKTNVVGSGNTKTDTFTAYALDSNQAPTSATTTAFDLNYGLTDPDSAVGFVDYVYQLKAVNGSATKYINLKTFNLTYGGTDAKPQKAIRVAIFAENITSTAPVGGASAAKLLDIYTVSGAKNFSQTEENASTNKAVSSPSALADVTKAYNSVAYALEAPNGATYYKIIVRLWLEGEDSTCNNETFANLKDKWSLDMEWQMEDTATTDMVLNASNDNSAIAKANLTGDLTIADTATVVEGNNYWAISEKTVNSKAIYIYTGTSTTKPTAVTASSHIFTIDGQYPTDVTNLCILPTT